VPDLRSIASRRLTTARTAAHNVPLAASVAVRRLGVDPVETVVRLADRLPASWLRRAESRPEARLLLADDDEVAAAVTTDALGGDAGRALDPGTLRRLVAVATSQNRTDLAADLLSRLPDDDPSRPRLTARLDWKLGLLTRARDDLALSPSTSPNPSRTPAIRSALPRRARFTASACWSTYVLMRVRSTRTAAGDWRAIRCASSIARTRRCAS